MHILDQIVEQKRKEIAELYAQHELANLAAEAVPGQWDFYQSVADAKEAGAPFFILEFKRKSPSEGWIQESATVEPQVLNYAQIGAKAISVLTDEVFFGGTYDDLRAARGVLDRSEDFGAGSVLLLQKDFILDPIQIYLARIAGADLILLIAAILDAAELEALRAVAESLGMGVLVEVHDHEELQKVQHLDFPVLGINNRDLKTFKTALNRVNVLAREANGRFVISESGIQDALDFALVRQADGFLIGTSLMRQLGTASEQPAFLGRQGKGLLKACGIRTPELLRTDTADLIGINFSPLSKRQINRDLLAQQSLPPNAVAVFYQNSSEEILAILAEFPFRRVQLYAGDVDLALVRHLRQKILLAAKISKAGDVAQLAAYAADVDCFILDSAVPGTGQVVAEGLIPLDFPYPFLLAGGITDKNAVNFRQYSNCIGIDVASGIETNGMVDTEKIAAIRSRI